MIKFKKIFGKKSTLLGTIMIILNLSLLLNTNLMKINLDNNDDEYIYNGQALNSASISNYKFYKNITILSSQVNGSGSHSNFPVLISLTDPDLQYQCQSDGDDIAFYDGVILLDYEIEYFDKSTGKLVAWVRIPSLSTSTDTIIRMYYGNPSLGNSEANPSGVWMNDFQAVWHLGERSGSTSRDSTSNGFVGTHVGDPTSQEGKIGYAQSFDGTDDEIQTSAYASGLGIDGNKMRTASLWAKVDIIEDHNWGDVFTIGNHWFSRFWLRRESAGSDEWLFLFYFLPGDSYEGQWKFIVPNTVGNWVYFSIVYRENREVKVYANGELTLYEMASHNVTTNDESPLIFGGGYHFDGLIDEGRFSNTTRSAEWIKTEYNNQNDPENFYIIGNSVTNPSYDPMLPTNPSEWMTFSIIILIAIASFVTTGIIGSIKHTSFKKYQSKRKSTKTNPFWVKNYIKKYEKEPFRPSKHPKNKNTHPPRNRSPY